MNKLNSIIAATKKAANALISITVVACTTPPTDRPSTVPALVHKFGSEEPGLISSHIGQRGTFIEAKGHIGVGFAASGGTPVYAVAEGRVQSPGPSGANSSNTLRVFSDRLRPAGMIVYVGLRDIQFTTGEQISPGQLLGYIEEPENTGKSNLHIALINTGTHEAFDPETYFLDATGSIECIDFRRVGVAASKGGYNSYRFKLASNGELEGAPLLFPFDCQIVAGS